MAVWNTTYCSSIAELGRFDADYFRPEYVAVQEKLAGGAPMRSVTAEIIHPGEFRRRYVQDGVLVVRTQNVRPLELSFGVNEIFVPVEVASELSRNRLRQDDILITRTGANFGQCSIFLGENREAIATSHTFILRVAGTIDPAYLTLFLNCRFGRSLLDQCAYGSAQPEIAPKFLMRFPIPRFGHHDEAQLATDIRKAYDLRSEATVCFADAQQLLESELGINEWSYQKPVGYTAKFSEVGSSRRLDSEHFYPAFSHFVSKLRDDICLTRFAKHLNFCKRGKQPQYQNDGLPVINSRHVQPNRVITSKNRYGSRGIDLDMEIRFGDLLINGTGRGTLGRAAAYLEETNSIPDNHVTILRTSEIDPIFLSYYLNSAAGQLQVEMHQRGSSGQLELYPFDIRKFLIWHAPNQLQSEIRELHVKGAMAEAKAKHLLGSAKTRVEQLIEEAVQL
jgi:type I restriction enzyme M protein